MAVTVATPANLNEFAQKLGQSLAEQGGGGSGDSNFVFIDSFIKKDSAVDDGKPHLYLVIDSSIDLTDVTLRYCRKGRVNCRRKESSPYHQNESGQKAHTAGWHQVWQLPLHTTKTPLIVPVFVSLTPAFTLGGNAYYEITVGEYDTMYDFANDSEFDTTYADENGDPISIGTILRKQGGVCLVRDGVQISNFAHFRTSYNEENDEWCIGR